MEFMATKIGWRVIADEDGDGDVKVSIKATVQSNSDDDEAFVEMQGVDQDGFELVSLVLTGHVPVRGTRVLTTTTYVNRTLFDQIVDWRQE